MQIIFIDHTKPEYSAQCLTEARALLTDPIVEVPYRYGEQAALIHQTTGPFHHVWLSGVPEDEEDHFKTYIGELAKAVREHTMVVRVMYHGQPPAPQRYSDFCWLFQIHNPDHFASRLREWLHPSEIVWEPAKLADAFMLHTLPATITNTSIPSRTITVIATNKPANVVNYVDDGNVVIEFGDNDLDSADNVMYWLAKLLRGYCPYDN